MAFASLRLMKNFTAVVVLGWLSGSAAVGQTTSGPAFRVGVFDRALVFFAYHRNENPFYQKELAAFNKAMEEARLAENRLLLLKLDLDGSPLRLAQVKKLDPALIRMIAKDSRKSTDVIVRNIKTQLPELARRTNVDLIVGDVFWLGTKADAVDITEALIEYFHPSLETRQMLQELRGALSVAEIARER